MKKTIVHLLLPALLVSLALTGCTTTKEASPTKFTFFPPPPDLPRIQYLTCFAADADLGRVSTFADFITGEQKTADPLIKPYGLAVHGGKVFVCDTVAGVIQVFDLKTRRASYFAPQGEGKLRLPINLTIDRDGTRYVADNGRQQILIYDAAGNFLAAIGKKDELKPTDVALTAGRIYTTDLRHHCVNVFNKATRELLFTIPATNSSTNQGRLLSPTNLALDENGKRLLVSDTGGNVVQVYDLDGNFIRTIGRAGVAPGMFARPKGIAVDRAGLVYVVDAATQVVQLFDPEGRLLLFFGQAGASTQGEVILPAAVKLDYDHVSFFQKFLASGKRCEYLIFVTSQFGGQKVSVYGFLKP